jgi:hypothetical protein
MNYINIFAAAEWYVTSEEDGQPLGGHKSSIVKFDLLLTTYELVSRDQVSLFIVICCIY